MICAFSSPCINSPFPLFISTKETQVSVKYWCNMYAVPNTALLLWWSYFRDWQLWCLFNFMSSPETVFLPHQPFAKQNTHLPVSRCLCCFTRSFLFAPWYGRPSPVFLSISVTLCPHPTPTRRYLTSLVCFCCMSSACVWDFVLPTSQRLSPDFVKEPAWEKARFFLPPFFLTSPSVKREHGTPSVSDRHRNR